MTCGALTIANVSPMLAAASDLAQVVVVAQPLVLALDAADLQLVVATQVVELAVSAPGATGEPGPQGPPGDASTSTMTRPAAHAIGGHRVVYVDAAGAFELASASLLLQLPVGITRNAAGAGAPLSAQTFGPLSHSGWAWDTSRDVFLADDGLLTQTPDPAIAVLRIGYPLTPTELFIDIDQPIMPE